MSNSDAEGFRLRLIGSLAASGTGSEDLLPRGRRARAILAIVALSENSRASRNTIIELLWARSGAKEARGSLRTALSELKLALAEGESSPLVSDSDHVWLETDQVAIDVAELFDRPSPEAPLPVETIKRASKGGFLEELFGLTAEFDQWLHRERSRFEDQLTDLLLRRIHHLRAVEDSASERALVARLAVDFDPMNEAASRELMQAHWDLGDRAAAMRAYERCEVALRQGLDAAPSKQTTALYQSIRTFRNDRAAAPAGDILRAVETTSQDRSPPIILPALGEAEFRDRPSIAVLPVQVHPAQTEHAFIGEGITEGVIEVLSRIPTLFVTSRLSSRAFRDTTLTPKQIGSQLGVRYLLSSSLRGDATKLRLSAELTDTQAGGALWSQSFDESASTLLDVQDRLARSVARALSLSVHQAEFRRLRSLRPGSLRAYELLLRGIDHMHGNSAASFHQAGEFFGAAIGQEPDYALAHAWRAYWHVLRVGQGWSTDRARDTDEADRYAARALQLDPGDAMGLAVKGHATSYLHKDFATAFDCFERALAINASSAVAWMWSGLAHAWTGDGGRAMSEVDRAISLTPCDPLLYAYYSSGGVAALVAEEFERAIDFSKRCIVENPTYTSGYRVITMSQILLGRVDEGRETARQLLKLEPGLTVSGFRARYPGSASKHCETWCKALAEAGVPN